MKRIFTLFAACLSLSAAIAQNVGVGTTSPGAKLTVNGAVASTPQSGPAGATITIPANVTIYTVTDDGASAANAATATGPVDGQFLTIYNTDAQAVTFAGQTIAASGGVMSFQYIASGWRLVSDNQSGGNNFIKNQTASPQSGAGFNTSGNGTIGGTLSVTGTSTLGALTQTGASSINTTGSAATSIGVGGTGAVNLGNSTGGVNVKTLTTAGVVTNTATGTLGTLPGTTSTVLHGNAAGAPSFGQVALGSEVSGILPIANGGTGSSAQNWVDLTTNQTAAGNKTWSGNASFGGTVNVSPFTSAGVVHNNASGLLSSSAVSLTSDVSGVLPVANGGTGSNLSATGGTGQYLKQTSAGGVVSVGTIPASDLSAGINGTTNTIPKFTGANTIGNSSVTDNGTTVSTSEPLASGAHTVTAGGTQAALVVNGTSNPEIVMQNSGTTKLEIGIAGGANAYISNAATNDATIRQTGGQKILFSTSTSGSTNDLTLSGGNVGIAQTAPGFPLNFANALGDKIALWGNTGAHYGFGIQSNLLQVHSDGSSSDVALGYGSSASFTENARFKGNGTVGIGTTTPNNAKVEIAGATTELLKLQSTLGGLGNHAYIDFLTYAGSGVNARIGAIDMNSYNGALVFEVNNNSAANNSTTSEAMRITNTGQVTIGNLANTGGYREVFADANGTLTTSTGGTSNAASNYILAASLTSSRDDLSTGATITALDNCDDCYSVQNLGFTVRVDGTDYTQVTVSNNGWIAFGNVASNSFSPTVPASFTSNPIIMPYYSDMRDYGSGEYIRTYSYGTAPARTFIVWANLRTNSGSNYAIEYQVQIHETSGLITCKYYGPNPNLCGQINPNGYNVSIGFQTSGGSGAKIYPVTLNGKVLDDNNAWDVWSVAPVR